MRFKVVWNEPDGTSHNAILAARSRRDAIKTIRRVVAACGTKVMYPRVWKVSAA